MLFAGEDGLASESTVGGDIELSIVEDVGSEDCRSDLGIGAVALDIRSTRRGRMCLPSEWV